MPIAMSNAGMIDRLETISERLYAPNLLVSLDRRIPRHGSRLHRLRDLRVGLHYNNERAGNEHYSFSDSAA